MKSEQLSLIFEPTASPKLTLAEFAEDLTGFREFQKPTRIEDFPDPEVDLQVFVNEFWTSKQRAASSLHEISYRACFKPQLPRFFIDRLTQERDVVYDPFMGRGTTLLEASLLGRYAAGCDINPLSNILLAPRLSPPDTADVERRLLDLDLSRRMEIREDLLVFYHRGTLRELTALREYLLEREASGALDEVDAWIRMVATNRLTGHSAGFFSVYTLPPNQAVSVDAQRKINEKRSQVPPRRDFKEIILRKSRSLLSKVSRAEIRTLREVAPGMQLLTGSCDRTQEIGDSAISLVVTSPPFLDVVDYQKDNWLRCWFNGIDSAKISIWQLKREEDWGAAMVRVFSELRRVLRPGGLVAFEVGEVRGGRLLMETLVVPAAIKAGLTPELVLVNDQVFTKTANCWGVSNFEKGTNTNRIILLQKED